jgi:Ca-activated chloride channel family protein
MTFGAPQWFWGLLIIPLLIFLFVQSERRSSERLRQFASERLLAKLAATVDRKRRAFRFALVLSGLALAIASLAQPRWGYTYEDVKRKGLDVLFAIDTSRSMLSNDVQPNRLQRVKLAAQDLINELQGDRVGLIAFAGRAFLQAPLTIDYEAAIEAINDLDTKTIPEGGTNISDAINLAVPTFGKSAIGNRALIIFTDGEELSGDAARTAKSAADAGVRIFAVGVGTPEGSLIPINGDTGETAFVKDSKGQVVKSKLDEKRLREIAESTGGFYLHLEDGPRGMKHLFTEGLGKMQAGQIDARTARRPIERYQWPLGASLAFLATSLFLRERKRARTAVPRTLKPNRALATATALLVLALNAFGSAPGLDAYRKDKFGDAYQEFERTLQEHPGTRAEDKIQFDAGAAAYKMKDYGNALNAFSQALLSPDTGLQGRSHYNLGNTLYERGEAQKSDETKLTDWNNALQHYEQTLKLDPKNKEAADNRDFVKRKIEELKKKREQPPPTPTPSPSPKSQENKKKDPQQDKQDQQKDQSSKQDEQKQEKQSQDKKDDQSKQEKSEDQSQAKNESGQDKSRKDDAKGEQTPSPSPGEQPSQQSERGPSPSPSPGKGEGQTENQNSSGNDQQQPAQSPTPSDSANPDASPSPGGGDNQQPEASPAPTASATPGKKLAGEVKGAGQEKPNQAAEAAQAAAQLEKEGQMSEKQAELLLQSMKDEEQRVQLDERKAARHVYNDW